MKKNTQLLILVGAPGSGKSTFAKYFLRTEENWMRVCRDDFRTMHFTWDNLPPQQEMLITEMIDASVEVLLRKNVNVIVDATHCRKEYIDHFIEKFNALADISFKVFDIDPEELAERCEKRYRETGKHIPPQVQKKFIRELEILKKEFDFSTRPKLIADTVSFAQNKDLPRALICDLDGTLTLMNDRNPFDASECDKDDLNEPVALVVKRFAASGGQVLLVSGREERFREPTLKFLKQHEISFSALWMRPTGDYRKDSIIKKEIYDNYIKDRFYVELVLDDRNQVVDMWRKEAKLPCFQVNYGNF